MARSQLVNDLKGHGIGAGSQRVDGSWKWEFEGFQVQADSWVAAGDGNGKHA